MIVTVTQQTVPIPFQINYISKPGQCLQPYAPNAEVNYEYASNSNMTIIAGDYLNITIGAYDIDYFEVNCTNGANFHINIVGVQNNIQPTQLQTNIQLKFIKILI